MLCLYLWQRCHIMEVEASGVHDPVCHKGWVHSNIRCSKGSHLAAPIVSRLLSDKSTWPSSANHLLVWNPVYHAKKKHIKVQFHHIRELVTEKKLEVWKIDTEVNIFDYLTKPLPEQRFGRLRTMMGLRQATKQKKVERGEKGKSKTDWPTQADPNKHTIWTSS